MHARILAQHLVPPFKKPCSFIYLPIHLWTSIYMHGPGTVLGDKDALVIKINNMRPHLKLFCRKLEDLVMGQLFFQPQGQSQYQKRGLCQGWVGRKGGGWVQRPCDCNIKFLFLTRLDGGWPWRISGTEQGVYGNTELRIAQPKGMGRSWAMEDRVGREEMCRD